MEQDIRATSNIRKDSNPMWNESIALAFPKKFEDVPIEDSPYN